MVGRRILSVPLFAFFSAAAAEKNANNAKRRPLRPYDAWRSWFDLGVIIQFSVVPAQPGGTRKFKNTGAILFLEEKERPYWPF